jgi:hypothetical protein
MRSVAQIASQYLSDLKFVGLVSDDAKLEKEAILNDIEFDFADLAWHPNLSSLFGTPEFFDSYSRNSRV